MMYCHLKPPSTMPLRTKNVGFLGNQRLNFDGSIYTRYAAPPYFAGIVIMASVYGRWVKTPALFFVIWHSFVGMRTVTKLAVLAPQFLGVNVSNF